jgi:hypothetical protein
MSTQEQTDRITQAVADADFSEMSFEEFCDLFEDRDQEEFI